MSTITKEFTKEQLQQIEAAAKEVLWPVVWSEKKAREHFSEKITPKVVLKLARIALASLEAEAVCVIDQSNLDYLKSGSDADVWPASRAEMGDVLLYRSATPAPVSVPAAMEMDDDFDSSFEHGKAVGWNAYRAAMLQGADRPQNEPQNIPENIPATQFKPVADLYGLTSPTGGETSFTFDAVEARDFIDGGWSCQEYVELERFQEAITNHTEDKLAMVDHSGDSNNMVEPVTTACKLREKVRREHAEWSQATFGDVGPVGPLKHLSKEALEAAAEPRDLSEWADMQFLLWDAQRRAGISDGEITAAMEEKLKVNMARQWPEPKDGEPRLHIKAAPQQEVK